MNDQIYFKDEIDRDCLDFINKHIGLETFIFLKNYYLTAKHGRMEIANLCFENYKNLCSGKYDEYLIHIKDEKIFIIFS